MTDEQRVSVVKWRLLGFTTEWAVYWAAYAPNGDHFEECEKDPSTYKYFTYAQCNLLDDEMKAMLKELQQ